MIDINELRRLALDGDLAAMQEIILRLEAAEKARDVLKAKIKAMEQQKPVAFALYSGWARKAVYLSEIEACEQRDRRQLTADLGGSLEAYRVAPLYALPGAQPAQSLASDDVSLISEGNTQPAQCVKDAIIDDLQSQFDTEGITEHDSGDALIRLSDAIAAVEDNFAQPAPGAPWVSLAERMPNPDKHDRVLIYTEGYDFGGEQVFDVKAEALNECRYIDPDEQPETCKAASHWMPHPRNAIFDYAAHCAQPAPSVPELIESLRCACNYIDKLGGVSQQYRAVLASPEANPAPSEQDESVRKSWARFSHELHRSPDAPYPGMSDAFEQHFSQSFTDREWRAEAATWAAAWKAAKRHCAKGD